ncbi:MAG: CNNM domain-containing protein [Planctomycetaceae bacterium]|jgi:putative hemolysin|nr:CNNM domain-containing protein [Planctomycetaceae bacterium]
MTEFLSSVELWLPGLIAMCVLVLASGFFSSSETALFSLSQEDIRRFRVGNAPQRVVAQLCHNPDRLLTAVLFWNLLINLSFFAISFVVSQKLIRSEQQFAGGAFGVFGMILMIVGGEVLPKSVAVVFSRRLSVLFSWPLAISIRLLDPVSPSLNRITRMARRTFWPHLKKEPILDADDLERAVDLTNLEKHVARHERQVLHNILDLSELRVEEVMRPRGSYVAIDPPFTLAAVGHESPPGDCVVLQEPGTEELNEAMLLLQFAHLPDDLLVQKTEPVIHVPWTASLAYTLHLMTGKFTHVASVVNEYGENIGIVTYDDIMDTVLSAEPSRARRVLKREPILEVAPGKFHVEGMTTLRYLSRRLDLNYDPEADGLLTVAGMLHEELEHLPRNGDECEWLGFRFRVIDASRRQLRVMVSKTVENDSLPNGTEGGTDE